ncbi:MAG: helix-turn-helix transcriptional regulator [Chloroflexi bacterium]|nr:helix-turn-helix transcriptional regulator [Chloroflexota bacterium]
MAISYINYHLECNIELVRSQAELARLTDIDRTTISALENNRMFLSIYYAVRIKEVLRCSLDDLYESIPGEWTEEDGLDE